MPLILSPTQAAFNARGNGKFNRPFREQIDFFRQKLDLPTAHWDDIIKSGNDRAFIVAGAAKADLLADFNAAIDKAIGDGKSIGWFKKEFEGIVQKHGWEGWTGGDTLAGRDWRARVIYNTNIRASYNAGRYAQLTDPELLQSRPYWKYVHNDTVAHPRPLHESWSGTVLRHDDAWWDSHFTPNGFGCRCRVAAVTAGEYKGHPAPDDGVYEKVDRFGDVHVLPKGVDYGWDYKPGANTGAALRAMAQDKLIRYPPAITKALSRDVNRYVNAHEDVAGFVEKAQTNKSLKETLWLGFVENETPINAVTGEDVKGYLVLLPSDAINHVESSHRFDGKGQRSATAKDYGQLQSVLAEGDIKPGEISATGLKRIVALKKIGAETFRAVFEIRPGAKNRALVLVSLAIKT